MVKREHVRTLRKFDDNGVPGAICAVVFGELYAQAPGLNADHRVELRIEIRGTPKHLRCNLIFLDWCARMIQDMFGKVAQQFAQRFRAMQDMAIH